MIVSSTPGAAIPATALPTVSGVAGSQLHHAISPAAVAAATVASMEATYLGQKDTTFTKIFVGGLPYHTSDKTLREHFEVYGEIEEAVVITDRQTGKSRGYGFVTMADRSSAERAIKDPNPVIDGRKANVNLAYLGAKPRGTAALAATYSPAAAAMRLVPTHLSTGAAYGLTTHSVPNYIYGMGLTYPPNPAAHFSLLPQPASQLIASPGAGYTSADYLAAYNAAAAQSYPATVQSTTGLETTYMALPHGGAAAAMPGIPGFGFPGLSHATAPTAATALTAGAISFPGPAAYQASAIPVSQSQAIQEVARMQ